MARADTAGDVGQSEISMLGIYLNDHLVGRRQAPSWRTGWRDPPAMDRTAARSGASRLRSRRTAPPCWTSWPPSTSRFAVTRWAPPGIGEKTGRLKFNGCLFARSPLSNLEELEMLRLGVEGKAAAAAPSPAATPALD
jgi:hypothetical protein